MAEKKKILFVIDNLKIGGIQKNMVNLLNTLCDTYEITLFIYNAVGEYLSQLPENIKIIEAKSAFHLLGMSQSEAMKKPLTAIARTFFWVVLKLFGNKTLYKLMLLTQKNIGKFDYAVSGMQSAVAGVFFSGCNELILEKVDAIEKITFVHCDWFECGVDNEYNRSVYRKMDKILVPYESNREQLLKAFPNMEDRIFVINNFCNFEYIEQNSKIDMVTYDKNHLNIISVARISPEKGIDRAIKIMKRLKDDGYKFTYHVIGGGGNYDELLNYVKDNGLEDCVYLHGYDANPYKYIPNADLILLPSVHDAAPQVINEARSLGVPALSTDTISAKEVIGNNNCGWVCDNSEDGIYEGLKSFLSDFDVVRNKASELKSIKCNNDVAKKQFDDMLK